MPAVEVEAFLFLEDANFAVVLLSLEAAVFVFDIFSGALAVFLVVAGDLVLVFAVAFVVDLVLDLVVDLEGIFVVALALFLASPFVDVFVFLLVGFTTFPTELALGLDLDVDIVSRALVSDVLALALVPLVREGLSVFLPVPLGDTSFLTPFLAALLLTAPFFSVLLTPDFFRSLVLAVGFVTFLGAVPTTAFLVILTVPEAPLGCRNSLFSTPFLNAVLNTLSKLGVVTL